ncbi:MAG: outer membrane lipoprotein-sorting protein [bacterium]
MTEHYLIRVPGCQRIRGAELISPIIRLAIVLHALCSLLFALSGEEVIKKVDENTVVGSISYSAKMVISFGGKIREKEFKGFVQGEERAYMEFTAPARDKGTRFLKINDEMWIYIPSVEKATKIAGHMLRQSMMGSDFSYDDVVENEKLLELYEVELVGSDSVNDRKTYKLQLTAKVDEVNYFFRTVWVDKETYIPVKTELYAKSGKLMKEVMVVDFQKIDGYNYPTRIIMVNKLRKDTYTELFLEQIQLDAIVPKKVFTKAYLERK